MPETPDPHGGGGIDPRIIDTEFMPALENLELFKASGIGPASAVNEHGSVQGLVTLINALEGPVGDLLPSISGICLGPSSARTDPGCLGALPPPSWIGSRQHATTSKGTASVSRSSRWTKTCMDKLVALLLGREIASRLRRLDPRGWFRMGG
jgi:hypothetical protein